MTQIGEDLRPGLIPINADFNLGGGGFGTDIIKKYTKLFQIGVPGLKIRQIFANFQCASFSIRKMWKNDHMVEKNANMKCFVKKKSLRSYTGHTKVVKNKKIDII